MPKYYVMMQCLQLVSALGCSRKNMANNLMLLLYMTNGFISIKNHLCCIFCQLLNRKMVQNLGIVDPGSGLMVGIEQRLEKHFEAEKH